ncbi:hypothetical protein [Segniliparus rugosus]|uniref:DUF4177 domain-containing protein n=1 Tax=Segniliparus rugosus (strain ATCC BAA-974 / DSM 45345 / CCUG 50838 / CIP 108380 / JCM 13579 / CDC 945) TaxID=679197 RepID=U1N8F9_SEGRC|nr:hypothetical protein [Segniliparus rugosus]ERG69138.1 hypothetical protein HMPREF9336_04282 [Segniliparus rugosus ATCC BAA-974]
MARYKTVTTYENNVDSESSFYGRDGWRVESVTRVDGHSDKVRIQFVQD